MRQVVAVLALTHFSSHSSMTFLEVLSSLGDFQHDTHPSSSSKMIDPTGANFVTALGGIVSHTGRHHTGL